MIFLKKCVLPESLERKYSSVHIAIFYKFAFHSCKFFCKLRHGIFFFFFNKRHCFKWQCRKVQIIMPWDCRPTSIK